MASSSSHSRKPNNKNKNKNAGGTHPHLQNTTFVQADPAYFRDLVQKLTGSSTDPKVQNNPVTISARPSVGKFHSVEVDPPRPSFMLQERRQSSSNLAIELDRQSGRSHGRYAFLPGKRGMHISPVSTLDMFLGSGTSPRTPVPLSPSLQEALAIANKGFYLHPTPIGTSTKPQPELLPLFPTSPDSQTESGQR